MFWDREERTLYLAHSCIVLRSPVIFDWQQTKLTLGFTCPRHRRLLKQNLRWFGRFIPFRKWNDDQTGFVGIWNEAEANAQYQRAHRR